MNYFFLKRFLLTATLIILGFVSSHAVGKTDMRLQDAIELALENNETLLIAKNGVESARQTVRQAWADALPDISFNGLYTRNFKTPVAFLPEIFINPAGDPNNLVPIAFGAKNSYAFVIRADQPLFQAGKVSGGIKAASLFKKYSSQGYHSVKASVTLEVKKAYYAVKLTEHLLAINKQSLEQQYSNLQNTRKVFAQGQVSELDTLRAWVDFTNLQPVVIQTENSLKILKNRLIQLIGLDSEDEINLITNLEFNETNGSVYDIEPLQEEAISKRPELKQLEIETQMRKTNIGVTRADHLPKLYLSGAYQKIAESNEYDFGAGLQTVFSGTVRLEFPIFSGFRTSSKVQQAKLDYQNSIYQLKQYKDNLKIEVNSILSNIKEAEKRVLVQRHAIKQAEKALYMSQRQYNEGVGTQLEVNGALLSLNITKTNHFQAVYDHKIALAELQKALGRQ